MVRVALYNIWLPQTQLCLTLCDLWTVASQASLSMGFFRQEYGDFLNPGIEPKSPALQVDSLAMSHQGSIRCGSQKENFHLLACS